MALVIGVSAQGPAAAPASPDDRRIAPQDLLLITIVGERDLQTEFRVSSSGSVFFPFVGAVMAKDLTPPEFAERLRQALMVDYFVDPQVIVTVKDYRQEFVYVIGQVNRPGPVAIPSERRIDILEAIAFANGTTRLARNRVNFTRNGVTISLSIDDLKKESDPNKKIWVQPGDIIEVRESVI
ncbi:MAG: polysaccharide export protein [Verrucomicrobia bacterium]|nr:polysaccharide export protein [Verrucomicrobiota bacterium]